MRIIHIHNVEEDCSTTLEGLFCPYSMFWVWSALLSPFRAPGLSQSIFLPTIQVLALTRKEKWDFEEWGPHEIAGSGFSEILEKLPGAFKTFRACESSMVGAGWGCLSGHKYPGLWNPKTWRVKLSQLIGTVCSEGEGVRGLQGIDNLEGKSIVRPQTFHSEDFIVWSAQMGCLGQVCDTL